MLELVTPAAATFSREIPGFIQQVPARNGPSSGAGSFDRTPAGARLALCRPQLAGLIGLAHNPAWRR